MMRAVAIFQAAYNGLSDDFSLEAVGMTAAKKLELLDWQEYLRGEERAKRKHEYREGYVYAMAGTTILHDVIVGNALYAIRQRLGRGPCRIHTADVKVRIRTDRGVRFYYPDCQVVCSPVKDAKGVFVDDPVVVVEVSSPSTRRIDEGEKREGYLGLSSLAAYLLVDSGQARVTVWRRRDSAFDSEVYGDVSTAIPLPEIGVELPLAEIYANVDWTKAAPSDEELEG